MTEVDVSRQLGEAGEHLRAGRWAEAESTARRLVEAGAGHPHAMHVLGLALTRLGRQDEALAWLKKSTEAAPRAGLYYANLAAALWESGDTRAALAAWDQALGLEPENARAWESYGDALLTTGDARRAGVAFQEALKRAPNSVGLRSKLLGALAWDPPDGDALENAHAAFGQVVSPAAAEIALANAPVWDRPLKVGYVLPADLSAAPFLEPILSRHDPEQVEAAVYADVPRPGVTANRLREQVTRWVDVSGLNNGKLMSLVQADGIDVLVDLGGHWSTRMGLFARRVAPVQAAYWGYPHGVGMPSLPYRISDAIADPQREGEPAGLLRLAPCAVAYRAPRGLPEAGPPPALRAKRVTFGAFVPARAVTEAVAAVWRGVLGAVGDARLIVAIEPEAGEAGRERIAHLLGMEDRVSVELVDDRLPVYERVDVALDAFPCSDPALVCEALWMGLPVVGMAAGTAARRTAARRTATVLAAAGLGENVATDAADYVAVARRIAASPVQLGALRRTLRTRLRGSDLMKEATLTRRLESVFRALWRAWCEGRSLT